MCVHRGKVEYELQLQAKYSEVKHWEDTISLLKLENKKLVDELNQEKVTVEDFRAQLHEAIGKQVVLQKQKDEIQAKMMQVSTCTTSTIILINCYDVVIVWRLPPVKTQSDISSTAVAPL